jgi:hypothetical protein
MKYIITWLLVTVATGKVEKRQTEYDDRKYAYQFYEFAMKEHLTPTHFDVRVDSVIIDSIKLK